MKVLSALSALVLIAVVMFFSENLYILGKYLASYSLIALSITAVIIWIKEVSSVLDTNAVAGKNSKA